MDAVDMDFQMNPRTDDLMGNGGRLDNGMIVLIQDHLQLMTRPDAEGKFRHGDERRYLENNRWCRVTELSRNSANGGMVNFVGVYEDGTKATRNYNRSYSWFYKIDSAGQPLKNWDFGTLPAVDKEVWVPKVRFVVHYDMCGGLTARKWANHVMGYHLNAGDICNWQFWGSVNGAWGIKTVVFTVDIELTKAENIQPSGLVAAGLNVLTYMIGDGSEINILGHQLLN